MTGITENLIVRVWQHQLVDRTDLVTEEGELIRIVYPSRLNNDRGADLLDAVIETSHGLIKGDVEVHVKSRDWTSHRHHQDPVYNRVILHVVFWRDTGVAAKLQSGEEVSTLVLNEYIDSKTIPGDASLDTKPLRNMLCRGVSGRLKTSFINKFLDSNGEERFLAKAAEFEADLTQMEASQSLYRGIMGALGYVRNKPPFLELARRVPLRVIESMTDDSTSDTEFLVRWQALLMGTAGLLPSQSSNCSGLDTNNEWVDKLEREWTFCRQTEVMSEKDWNFFRIRPNNYPARRIAAMSYLLLRYREKGILEEVISKVWEAAVIKDYRLEESLVVSTNDYWARYLDFGLHGRTAIPTLLGRRRAADIVVNVLLPFIFALGRFISRPELARKALEIYRYYPRLGVNTIERHMNNQLGLNSDLVNSALRQQGLLHIYKKLCSEGGCSHCQLGRSGEQADSTAQSGLCLSL